ncbi:MAG TPA: glycoside hydrolase family 3 protein [Nakamurella sp.]|nr:glycoside hydrolase family 3 protein [Nakamurella sp.]
MTMRSRTRRLLVPIATTAVALALAAAPATAGPAPRAGGQAGATDPAAAALADMTTDQKIGQLFETYVYGTSATDVTASEAATNQRLYGVDTGAEVVAKYHLGAVIYFSWTDNLQDPIQIATLSNGLQQAASDAGDPPLLISTDQEGGNVTRIGAPLAVSPGNMALGATFSPGDSYDMSHATGQQLAALGINVDDAPVADVNTNPQNSADGPRSFGDRAGHVAAMVRASVTGYQDAGIAATVKHFPGLGSTAINTDNGVAVSDETIQQIRRNDLPPFRQAIAAGVDEIMAAHIVMPALDPSGAPASVSAPIVTGLLRHTLHYNGVVVTDALSAAALEGIPADQRALRAFEAGDDLLLMPENLGASIDAIRQALQSGEITMARLDESVLRILRLKQKLGLFDNAMVDASTVLSRVGTDQQDAIAARAARDSITLVRNDDGTLPLTPDSGASVLVTGWGVGTTSTLTADIASHGVTVDRMWTGSPSQATIDAVVAAAKTHDYVVVTTDNAWGDASQQSLVNQLLATGTPVIAVAVAAPYGLAYFPSAPTFLAGYGYQADTLAAVADVLFGAQPLGHLPVTIRSADGSGVVAHYATGMRYPVG